MTPQYEVFALRYAWRDAKRAEHFIGGDPHDAPMPMDYFVWVIKGADRNIVVDTGFTAEVAARRKREYLRCPIDSLPMLGVNAADVKDVILTHLHYATGRYMRHARLAHSFEPEDVVGMVRLNFKKRVRFYNGDAEIAPGVSVHLMRGHSAGLQCVRVNTRRGPVVLASDVTHFYENMEAGRPFTTAFHVGEMLEGYDTLHRLAPSPRHIVPGHDPEVMRRYPAVPGLEGIAVRLDEPPTA